MKVFIVEKQMLKRKKRTFTEKLSETFSVSIKGDYTTCCYEIPAVFNDPKTCDKWIKKEKKSIEKEFGKDALDYDMFFDGDTDTCFTFSISIRDVIDT